ncbi:MAG TPA: LptA/OstA family protein [Steroidobacteraceae bacterium]|jgi:lipopolysaccharide transport protein LptA|nr:LptA/OstA family protein [Steroidobacteraceae bacterium]
MALSPLRPSSLRAWRLAFAAPLALAFVSHAGAAANAPAAAPGKCNEPINVDAKTFDVDYKENTTQLRNVVISQCDIRVQAEHASATGLNFDNARWTFDGAVKVDVENRGNLRSDRAVVDFENSQISKVTIIGSPAEFEQRQNDTNMVARGRAGEIVYEVGAGTVRLVNDAWLKYGTTETAAPSLVYNIRQEQVQGVSQPGQSGGRVHIRISPKKPTAPPKSSPNDAGAKPATPPQSP